MSRYIKREDAVFAACKVLDKFGGCKMGPLCPDVGCSEVRDIINTFNMIEIPDQHGRLGDLDALYEKFSRLESEAMNALKTTTTGSVNWIKWSAILTERTGYKHDIADAPTIIQAEEAEQ